MFDFDPLGPRQEAASLAQVLHDLSRRVQVERVHPRLQASDRLHAENHHHPAREQRSLAVHAPELGLAQVQACGRHHTTFISLASQTLVLQDL